jgi:hypothetical protein
MGLGVVEDVPDALTMHIRPDRGGRHHKSAHLRRTLVELVRRDEGTPAFRQHDETTLEHGLVVSEIEHGSEFQHPPAQNRRGLEPLGTIR